MCRFIPTVLKRNINSCLLCTRLIVINFKQPLALVQLLLDTRLHILIKEMEEHHRQEINDIVGSFLHQWPVFVDIKLGLNSVEIGHLEKIYGNQPAYMRLVTVDTWMASMPDHLTIDDKIQVLRQKKNEFFKKNTGGASGESQPRSDVVDTLKYSTSAQYAAHLRNIGSGDTSIYPIREDLEKGEVLIINNMFKGTPAERGGSEHDVESMDELWSKIGLTVTVLKNLTAEKMIKKVEAFAREVSDVSICVLIIMTHGDAKDGKSILYGNNATPETKNEPGVFVVVDDLLQKFTSAFTHPQHIFPKLVIFEACRGSRVGPTPDYIPSPDMYVAYPTKQDYVAWLDDDGSWFIKAIKRVFNASAHNKDVAKMFEEVKEYIHDTYKGKQEVDTESSIGERKLFLYPGWPKRH